MEYRYKLGFLGAGNMAKAIANGIIKSNILKADEVVMSDPFVTGNVAGIKVINDNKVIFNDCEYVLLAVKPQIFNQIVDELKETKVKNVISIMAGVKMAKIKNILPNAQVIRIMPNLPASVGAGMAGIAKDNNASKEANEFTKAIFDSVGKAIFVNESDLDAVTAISGSGPAYVYYFIQSMIKGGIKNGLSEEAAKELTLQTFVGAVEMVKHSNDDLDTMIDRVCSKGGTTIQAIDTFRSYDLDDKIIEGIDKCRIRSEELSK
ncbi:MAG: pyrroline-5-carboxylate reductase [Clostridiales bacterium]|nr:pyrroline-5-carboxylate reductase [Clostridiales bacterium]